MFEKYSGDEGFALIVSAILGLGTWVFWLRDSLFVMRPWVKNSSRITLIVAPLLSAALLFTVLKLFAAGDVRDDPAYLLLYIMMGAAWLGVAQRLLPLFGLSARDNVIERGNLAAGFAISGALIGITCCFAGANIGDGPGWWVVVFSGGLASATFAIFWVVFARVTCAADAITIERDVAAGVRAAGFFIGTGLILGRAAAGNWVSPARTLEDFARVGWPAILLLALAIAVERQFPPRLDQDATSILVRGGIVAATYVLAGAGVILLAGHW